MIDQKLVDLNMFQLESLSLTQVISLTLLITTIGTLIVTFEMIVKLDQFSEVGILKGLSIFVRSKQQKLLHHHHFFKFAILLEAYFLFL